VRLPIDVSNLTFIAGSDPAAVLDMERRPRADTATGEVLWRLDVVALGGEDGAEATPVVLGAQVRVLADAVGVLFERDRQLAGALNAAQRRLLGANERLVAEMPVGAVLLALCGPVDADLGLAGRRPPVLEGEDAVAALGEVADTIRRAFLTYQDAAEERRQLAADVGEATVRLVDALTAAGLSESQARHADVRALRDGAYRER
jgi:hypothetical protein